MTTRRHRIVHPEFAEIADAFTSAPREGFGAQLCVSVAGEIVLDLAEGIAHDAIMTVYSATKRRGRLHARAPGSTAAN